MVALARKHETVTQEDVSFLASVPTASLFAEIAANDYVEARIAACKAWLRIGESTTAQEADAAIAAYNNLLCEAGDLSLSFESILEHLSDHGHEAEAEQLRERVRQQIKSVKQAFVYASNGGAK